MKHKFPWRVARNMVAPARLHVYPGMLIPVELSDDLFWLGQDGIYQMKPLPPGVPLDEDIFVSLLYHLTGWSNVNKLFVNGKCVAKDVDFFQDLATSKIQLMYMEALWRQIKRKKEQSCSGI